MTFRPSLVSALALVLGGIVLVGCAPRSGVPSRDAPGQLSRSKDADSRAAQEKRIRTAAHYATALSYDLNDKPELALEEMLRAAEIDPNNEPVVVEAARRCIRAQKPDKAIDLLTKATAHAGASGGLYAWLGLAYSQAGQTNLAIAADRTAMKKAPQSLTPYQNLAQIYLLTSRTNEALRVLDDAARQPTDDPGFLIDLADLYVRFGHVQATQRESINQRIRGLLDRAADLGSANPLQKLRLAEAYFALGELKKAEPLYRELLEDHPDLSNIRTKLVEIYLRSDQKEKASEQLEALAQSEPTNPQVHLFLGSLAVEEKKYPEAAEHFERALKLDPDLEQVYYELAGLKISSNKPADAQAALATLDKARSKFKLSFPMEFYTGLAYRALEKYPAALNALTSAEAIAKATDPSRLNTGFYFQMGATQERAGHLEDAEKYFREALKLSPDDPESLNYLGYMWAEHGIKLQEARVLIEKAVHLKPDDSNFLDSLAWVFFKLNQPQEALAPMLKALQLTGEPDPTLYDHLGDIYCALKQIDLAREAWTKALQIKPDEQIQQKLQANPAVSHSAP
jgi:tetratricopeptide (TPR) repeat protein